MQSTHALVLRAQRGTQQPLAGWRNNTHCNRDLLFNSTDERDISSCVVFAVPGVHAAAFTAVGELLGRVAGCGRHAVRCFSVGNAQGHVRCACNHAGAHQATPRCRIVVWALASRSRGSKKARDGWIWVQCTALF